jgi:hypothetical protein
MKPRWFIDEIGYDGYSTEMADLPQHIETRRREIVQARRMRRVWLVALAVGAVVIVALTLTLSH